MRSKIIAQGAVDGLTPASGNTIKLNDAAKIKIYCLPPDDEGTAYFVDILVRVTSYGYTKAARSYTTRDRHKLVQRIARLINQYKNYSPVQQSTNDTHSNAVK